MHLAAFGSNVGHELFPPVVIRARSSADTRPPHAHTHAHMHALEFGRQSVTGRSQDGPQVLAAYEMAAAAVDASYA